MPLDTAKEYAGAIVGAFTALITGAWALINMIFTARGEAKRAHQRLDSLESRLDDSNKKLLAELRRFESKAEARDARIEDKIDRLIRDQMVRQR